MRNILCSFDCSIGISIKLCVNDVFSHERGRRKILMRFVLSRNQNNVVKIN